MAENKQTKEIEEGKAFAFLAIFLGLIGFLIVLLTKKENKYAMFYAKQSLILSIVWIVGSLIIWIPIVG